MTQNGGTGIKLSAVLGFPCTLEVTVYKLQGSVHKKKKIYIYKNIINWYVPIKSFDRNGVDKIIKTLITGNGNSLQEVVVQQQSRKKKVFFKSAPEKINERQKRVFLFDSS